MALALALDRQFPIVSDLRVFSEAILTGPLELATVYVGLDTSSRAAGLRVGQVPLPNR